MEPYGRTDLSLVGTFEAVANSKSFSKAAKLLKLSQSTVSDHVRLLEVKTGSTLITRTTRSLSLTKSGETMLVYAQALLAVSDQIGEHFTRASNGQVLRIGLTQDLATARLASLLKLFRADNPGSGMLVRTKSTSGLLEMLDAGEVDIVVGKQAIGTTWGKRLWRSKSIWVGNGDLVTDRHRPVPLVVDLAENSVSRTIALQALGSAGIPWQIVMEGDTLICLQAALEAELGVAVSTQDYRPDFAVPIDDHAVLPKLADQEFFIKVRSVQPNDPVRGFSIFIEQAVLRLRATDRRSLGSG